MILRAAPGSGLSPALAACHSVSAVSTAVRVHPLSRGNAGLVVADFLDDDPPDGDVADRRGPRAGLRTGNGDFRSLRTLTRLRTSSFVRPRATA